MRHRRGYATSADERRPNPCELTAETSIYDAACGRIQEPAALAFALKSVTGVVEHGLFLDLADRQALIGTANGVTTLEP